MRKIADQEELVNTILGALGCQGHFDKPTIIENDPYFKIGEDAQVICGQCVQRMRDAIGVTRNEDVPCHFQYWEYRVADEKE